ncbi:hypothetical protein [Clostridium estertheticum]|uniref:Uncharacterized protein n=1 Tax=Clostridium estertheticum TaxID=238834 RepID=A0AA47I8C6_9CLOT|nr:hypothetical protein [Clostridium estertheticum]MBU3157353.1 hypothetical protein [Clostridium estertheticum]WAG62468.1 hypothetical protein LL038_09620 [Clostridium estertheticum]
MLIQALLTLPVLIAFIFIYRKYKTDNEEFLLLKLIGYYLLGSFRFNFNKIALPAGFIAYLVFFRPKINKPVKKALVSLGLFVFICGLLIPVIQKSYFERQRIVNASSNNIFTINLNRDHNAIKQKLGISEYTKIEDFVASFEKSGAIKELRYKFLTNDNKGIVLYNVNFSSNKNQYIINTTKVSEWVQYNRLITEEQFFYALDSLDLKQLKPKVEYPLYSIRCSGDYTSWNAQDSNNFLISDKGLNKLNNEDLPVSGYTFWIYGNKRTSKTTSSGDSYKSYILPIRK